MGKKGLLYEDGTVARWDTKTKSGKIRSNDGDTLKVSENQIGGLRVCGQGLPRAATGRVSEGRFAVVCPVRWPGRPWGPHGGPRIRRRLTAYTSDRSFPWQAPDGCAVGSGYALVGFLCMDLCNTYPPPPLVQATPVVAPHGALLDIRDNL